MIKMVKSKKELEHHHSERIKNETWREMYKLDTGKKPFPKAKLHFK